MKLRLLALALVVCGGAAAQNPYIALQGADETSGGIVVSQPRTVLARLEDASGRPVSDEHRLVCDMTAEDNTLRTLRVAFRLLGSGYDRNAEYPLVLRDAETHAELQRIPFRIDVIFENDFDL